MKTSLNTFFSSDSSWPFLTLWNIAKSSNCSLAGFHLTEFRPRHAKTCLPGICDSEGSDQPAHPHSLIIFRLHCPLAKSLVATECLNGEERPGCMKRKDPDVWRGKTLMYRRSFRMSKGIFCCSLTDKSHSYNKRCLPVMLEQQTPSPVCASAQ